MNEIALKAACRAQSLLLTELYMHCMETLRWASSDDPWVTNRGEPGMAICQNFHELYPERDDLTADPYVASLTENVRCYSDLLINLSEIRKTNGDTHAWFASVNGSRFTEKLMVGLESLIPYETAGIIAYAKHRELPSAPEWCVMFSATPTASDPFAMPGTDAGADAGAAAEPGRPA